MLLSFRSPWISHRIPFAPSFIFQRFLVLNAQIPYVSDFKLENMNNVIFQNLNSSLSIIFRMLGSLFNLPSESAFHLIRFEKVYSTLVNLIINIHQKLQSVLFRFYQFFGYKLHSFFTLPIECISVTTCVEEIISIILTDFFSPTRENCKSMPVSLKRWFNIILLSIFLIKRHLKRLVWPYSRKIF